MRIVVFGDFQLLNTPRSMTRQAIADIGNLKPDTVVMLGDYGDEAYLGYPQAIKQLHGMLSGVGAPVFPLLGNHDLQHEIGCNVQPHGVMEKAICERFGVESTFFIQEHEDFRVFGISLEDMDIDPPYSPGECHVSDERFAWIRQMIAKRPGVPIIMLTHAPPMGCGLKTLLKIHGRSANLYMDQSTNPMRWIELTEHPEILLWLSAHYHLGHDHQRSLCVRNSVVYALTGVHGRVTRDGTRHTRVIDVENGILKLKTFDHIKRILRETPDHQIDLKAALALRTALHPRVSLPAGENWMRQFMPPGPGGIQALPNGRQLVSTRDGYLWEVDPEWEAVYGTLHLQEGPLIDYCVSDRIVWRAFGTLLAAVHTEDPRRFSRNENAEDYRRDMRVQLPGPAQALRPAPGGGVTVQIGDETLTYTADF